MDAIDSGAEKRKHEKRTMTKNRKPRKERVQKTNLRLTPERAIGRKVS